MNFDDVGVIYHAKTANDAWEKWYDRLSYQAANGKLQDSRDGEIVGEIIGATTIIEDPTRFIVTSPIRKMPMRYAVAELLWYLSGTNKLSAIQPFTKAWNRMSDDGKTVNSNYGNKIRKYYNFDQWEFCLEMLKKDPLSRQAVIHIKNADNYLDFPTNDVPCTLTLQFLIRDGKLNLIVNMRSNDIWMGFPYDVFNFCALQNKMAMELSIPVGKYIHVAGSLHLYKRDYVEKENSHGDAGQKTDDKAI